MGDLHVARHPVQVRRHDRLNAAGSGQLNDLAEVSSLFPGRAPGDVGRADPDQRSRRFADGIGIGVHERDPILFDAQDFGRVFLTLADLIVETFAVDGLLHGEPGQQVEVEDRIGVRASRASHLRR